MASPTAWIHCHLYCALLGPGVGQALGVADTAVVVACFPTGPDRELQTVRRAMIDFLQNHTDGNRPPACPALDPIRCAVL